MNERGFSLVEALVAVSIMSAVGAAVIGVAAALPAQAARWDGAAEARQRLRVVDALAGRLTANAGPIVLRVDGATARVPSIWPRRLGLLRSGAPAEVSSTAVTFLSRISSQSGLTLETGLAGSGGDVVATAWPGCGSSVWCGLSEGDTVLVVARDSVCGLYRVNATGARLAVDALMASPGFAAGAAIVPVSVTTLFFDDASGEVRAYDGYRSDNVVVDGIETFAVTLEAGAPPGFEPAERGGPFADEAGGWRGTGRFGDGPFAGAGSMAFDIDQLAVGGVGLSVVLQHQAGGQSGGAAMSWRTRPWR